MYPLSFVPLYKNFLWGGRLLSSYRPSLVDSIYAESWELSDRKGDMSLVASGPLKGKTLSDLVSTMGERLYGKGRRYKRFPLLLKIIDAKEPLSVQIHPSSGAGAKNEAWFFLGDHPSCVYAGWKTGMNASILQENIRQKSVESILRKIFVERGDFLYIPGGVVHSIGAKSFLLEIQNNEDTTYRLYDWERRDKEGKTRPLHIQEAVEAIDWQKKPLQIRKKEEIWFATEQFLIQTLSFQKEKREIVDPSSFLIFFFTEGRGTIATAGGEERYSPMTSFLIAAESREVFLQADLPSKAIKISLPLEKKQIF